MSDKRDEPPEKKKKVDRTKCHFKQAWKVINKAMPEKSSYTYYRPLSYHVPVLTGSDRQASSAVCASKCYIQPKLF